MFCLSSKRKAKRKLTEGGAALRSVHPGAITYVQRFGGAINVNIHFHILFLDGVFVESEQIDVTQCPDCGGEVRLIAVIDQPKVIRKILDHVGLPSSPPHRHAISRQTIDDWLDIPQDPVWD